MKKKSNNYAFIDGANLHNGIIGFGWQLDYARFKVWLSEKYGVKSILQIRKEKAPDADGTA